MYSFRCVARIFQRWGGGGGGGITLCESDGSTHHIVTAFLPPFIGCLPKKRLTKGGGGGVTGTSRPPVAMPLSSHCNLNHAVWLWLWVID